MAQRDDIVGLDASIIMHPTVWKASGHVDEFHDMLVDCKDCRKRYRADHLETEDCPECSGVARPNVMMFGDWDWIREPTEQQAERFYAWRKTLEAEGARVALVEIGAGTELPAIRQQSETLLQELTGRLIRINPREAGGSKGTLSIPLPGLEALEKIERVLLDMSEDIINA